MRSITKMLLAATVLVGLGCRGVPNDAATEADTPGSKAPRTETVPAAESHQRVGLQTVPLCPEHLIGYCRGWEVSEVSDQIKPNPDIPDDLGHLDISDKVAVGTASGASDQTLWLFARSKKPGAGKGPADRWGANKIRLFEINKDGKHDCLAGNVKLPEHGNADEPHVWHKVTLRLEPVPESPIGNEQRLAICFSALNTGGGSGNPSPPDTCAKNECPDEEVKVDDTVYLMHGGVAHAQD